jgi:CO/xanthine dehydrogenase Mo-binding subunit
MHHVEDARFIRGQAASSTTSSCRACAAILRSPYAHAKIVSIDVGC